MPPGFATPCWQQGPGRAWGNPFHPGQACAASHCRMSSSSWRLSTGTADREQVSYCLFVLRWAGRLLGRQCPVPCQPPARSDAFSGLDHVRIFLLSAGLMTPNCPGGTVGRVAGLAADHPPADDLPGHLPSPGGRLVPRPSVDDPPLFADAEGEGGRGRGTDGGGGDRAQTRKRAGEEDATPGVPRK